MPIILIIALIAALSGISVKAESAVPGDVLYPVKTHIDEPIAGFFSLSANGRIAAQEHQAGERLGEAEQLAASGLLDTATKSSLEAAFEARSKGALEGIRSMASSGDVAGAQAEATAFRSILEKHQSALAAAYGARTDSASLAADISSSVAVQLGVAESLQADAAQMASASYPPVAQAVQAPEAGGPVLDDSTSTPADSIRSAILSLLQKVI